MRLLSSTSSAKSVFAYKVDSTDPLFCLIWVKRRYISSSNTPRG